jgi:hypothetical protein
MASPILISRSNDDKVGLNPHSIRYAIEQLARRAGVSDEVFRTWSTDLTDREFVSVFVQPGTRKCVRFPRVGAGAWNQIQRGNFSMSSARWMTDFDRPHESIPDFRIPFSSSRQAELGPLFVPDSAESFTCAVDLPLSTVLTLSRFEETFPSPKDAHGRFPAYASVAWQGDFLHRPIVDEYGLALEQVLTSLLPGWRPAKRHLRVKLSQDVDQIGIPFSLRSAFAKTFRDRRPLSTVRDLAALLLGTDTTYQLQLKRLVRLSVEHGLDSAIYWKSSKIGPYDTGYDLNDPRILGLIYGLRAEGIEMGIHPSYATFQSPRLLRSEVQRLKAVLGQKLGGRQDYLRWNPQTWVEWNDAGLAYDSSVGFADHIGFRAGTCIPYQPWLWSQQRRADLIEIPLLAMDSTMYGYMNLPAERALTLLMDLAERCRAVGGVFTLAWHNTSLVKAGYASIYRALLNEIADSPTFDWRHHSA